MEVGRRVSGREEERGIEEENPCRRKDIILFYFIFCTKVICR
jgi:hypothetical protein